MDAPVVSVVLPTRGRARYLEVALDSLDSQDLEEPWELLVVDDRSQDGTADLLRRRGVRSLRLEPPGGLNAARNAGVRSTSGDLIAFTDDDVRAPSGWLRAIVEGARRHPEADAFGGPIRARFEGPAPRGCGREDPPLTTLDLGEADRPAELAWGANMALRRGAFARIGQFDESIHGGGDEQEWLERLAADGGRLVYLADAALEHRREGDDARLVPLARGAYARGRSMRAYDSRRGRAPGVSRELRVLAGCGWHTLRRACPQGIVMGAHALGRTVEAVRKR
ncbi:MAG TPA: glycosyltransferase family A protein [Thermoleophilaceae bacterium]|nr:glycosyltransferase family A protein [Thermoleophilaceae bacterium]